MIDNVVDWQGQKLRIVPDGAISKDYFVPGTKRILHILKESTKQTALGTGLQQYIRSDGTVKWRLWNVTARRSFAIQHDLPRWCDMKPHEFGKAFSASAVINLNDTIPEDMDWRPSTDTDALIAIARFRWPERYRLLNMLKPDVVVCGGTWHLVHQLMIEGGKAIESYENHFMWHGVPFIQAYHPSFRGLRHEVEYERFRRACFIATKMVSGQ